MNGKGERKKGIGEQTVIPWDIDTSPKPEGSASPDEWGKWIRENFEGLSEEAIESIVERIKAEEE